MKRAPFLLTAYSFLVVMAGTTLPTALYSLFQEKFHFSALTVTLLFAIYAVAVVVTLLLFGRLSDDIGRKPVLLIAAVLAALSAIAFLLADNVGVMFLGRILSGISAGLMTGTATATLLDFGGQENRARSATIALTANIGGLAIGSFGSGVLAEWVGNPLHVPFAIDLVLTVIAIGALLALPKEVAERKFQMRLQKPTVPAAVRTTFFQTSLAAGTGFSVLGVLTAITSLFLARELGLHNHALAGGVVAIALIGTPIGQLLIRRMKQALVLPVGCSLLILAAVFMTIALTTDTLAPLILAAVSVGLGAGICTGAGLQAVGANVEPDQRGATSSSFFMVTYVGLAIPAIAVGLIEQFTSLTTVGVLFSALVALFAAAVLVDLRRRA